MCLRVVQEVVYSQQFDFAFIAFEKLLRQCYWWFAHGISFSISSPPNIVSRKLTASASAHPDKTVSAKEFGGTGSCPSASPNGAKQVSPGQRPGFCFQTRPSPEGAR